MSLSGLRLDCYLMQMEAMVGSEARMDNVPPLAIRAWTQMQAKKAEQFFSFKGECKLTGQKAE